MKEREILSCSPLAENAPATGGRGMGTKEVKTRLKKPELSVLI